MSGALTDALRPRFQAARVRALMSTRTGGVSWGVFDSLNLRDGIGDDTVAVHENQARFAAATHAHPVWLQQVHGTRVVELPWLDTNELLPPADACVTTEPGVVCAVQVADCLPVLFAAPEGRGVAAAHAGWRGLAAGVLETTVSALCRRTGCEPAEIEAWLGPCIGPRQFEVGADVLEAFGARPGVPAPHFVAQGAGKWLADLPGLARERLAAQGLRRIEGGLWCTVEDASRFFSFRRDRPLHGNSGRMAAAIWIERG